MNLNVSKAMADAREAMSEGAFQQAGGILSNAKNIVREEVQLKTKGEIKKIIDKLQSETTMTNDEIALIKAWIIGDAIGYTKMENNFADWLAEYERLENELIGYENKECSPEELFKFHGVLEDANRVSYDIAYFLENQDRIKKFEAAVGSGLGERERNFLAKTLLGKLNSPDY
ncbi:MAG: hypothetical protein PF503_20670 [Desulfobacula sp.]|nr:hypothetical protein [Desulfobacula sp.]